MWELVRAGGPFMWPIIICSIALVGIVLERLWTLQRKRVLPQELIKKVSELAERNQVSPKVIEALEKNSALGRVLAAALGAAGARCPAARTRRLAGAAHAR
jgi:biopolymer transport protein ExbB